MSTPHPSDASTPSGLSDADYRALAQGVLAHIEAMVDRWLDQDIADIDSHRTGGLLELSLPGAGGKLVINMQPPLHELWLAARSGGYHFRPRDGQWLDTRDGRDFYDVISLALQEQTGLSLRIDPPV